MPRHGKRVGVCFVELGISIDDLGTLDKLERALVKLSTAVEDMPWRVDLKEARVLVSQARERLADSLHSPHPPQ